jgi:uncharacterized protein (TIGR03437 family)
MRYASIILLSAGLHLAGSVPSSVARSRLSFEPNVGQANPRVKFLAHSGARAIYLTNSGVEISGVELQFQGGNCAAISGLRPLSERHNYFGGASSRLRAVTNITTYQRVRCEQVYPGIDAEFYGDRGSLEYDLIIAPHADSSVVRLAWKYAKQVQIDRDGDLIIDTPGGVLRQHRPVVYQISNRERRMVQGDYVVAGNNEVRLSLGAYDRDLPLVIDPVLFAVDANAAPAGPMAVDSSGNIYLAGYTDTSSFESTAGSVQPTFGGGTCESGNIVPSAPPTFYPCTDAYVVKLDANGGVIYATYLGGTGSDVATSIAVDSSGNAYIAGTTYPENPSIPNNFPVTPGAAFTKPSADGVDDFVAKLNPTGDKLIYSTFIPELNGAALAVDAQGAAYIAGRALPPSSGALGSTGFPTTPGAFQTTSTATDGVAGIAKLNPAGSALVYATYLGGPNPINDGYFDGASGIAVDALGEAHVTGWTSSADFPTTPGAFDTTPPNGLVTYVAKLNPTGSGLIYSTLLSQANSPVSLIKLDSKGNAYILGNTSSSNFPVTAGAFQPSGPSAPWLEVGYQSALIGQFLSALNADGTALIYSTYLTGAAVSDGAQGLDVDAAGDAYVVGVASYNFPVTSGAFQRCVTNGTGDIFAVEFNPSGQAIASTYLGANGIETPTAIVAGPNGSSYIAGTTSSTDFPGIVGAESGVALTFVTQIQINNPQTTDGPCISQVLQNAATFAEGPVVPGELVTIRGAGIGPANGVAGAPGPNGRYPTQLSGVQVSFDGFPAPLLYVQGQQINTVVPWEVAGDYNSQYAGGTEVSVKIGSVTTNTFTNPLAAAAPGIFVVNAANQGAVLNQDGTPNSPSNPAAPGSIIAIYGTGGGSTSPMGQTGALSPLIQTPLTLPVTVQIDGQSVDVTYAGAAPGLISGVVQINVRIPDTTPSGSASLGLTIGSIASPTMPTIAIQ